MWNNEEAKLKEKFYKKKKLWNPLIESFCFRLPDDVAQHYLHLTWKKWVLSALHFIKWIVIFLIFFIPNIFFQPRIFQPDYKPAFDGSNRTSVSLGDRLVKMYGNPEMTTVSKKSKVVTPPKYITNIIHNVIEKGILKRSKYYFSF